MRPLRRKSPTDPFQMTGTILKGTINGKLLANSLFTHGRGPENPSSSPCRHRAFGQNPKEPGPGAPGEHPRPTLSAIITVSCAPETQTTCPDCGVAGGCRPSGGGAASAP